MSLERRFGGLDLMALWSLVDADPLPPPLLYLTGTKYIRDAERELADARARVQVDLDPCVLEALELLAHAQIRVMVWASHRERLDDPDRIVRIAAGRRGDHSCIVRQLPGESYWHSGGYVVTSGPALELGAELAARMPDCARGRHGEIALTTHEAAAEFEYDHGRSSVRGSFDATHWERSEAFLTAPTIRSGKVRVLQLQSKYGPRGAAVREFSWRDLVDDGRYVLTPGTPPIAVGVDRAGLTALINEQIKAVVRAITDER